MDYKTLRDTARERGDDGACGIISCAAALDCDYGAARELMIKLCSYRQGYGVSTRMLVRFWDSVMRKLPSGTGLGPEAARRIGKTVRLKRVQAAFMFPADEVDAAFLLAIEHLD